MAYGAAPMRGRPHLQLVTSETVAEKVAPEGRDGIRHHTRLIEMFEEAEDSSRDNREKAERDIDYRDGKQWTEKQVAELRRRGQPAITHPLIRQKVDYLLGLERAQRTDPRALPRNPTPQDEGAAEAATDSLRFVCEQQRYDQSRSRTWEDILVAGWGGIEVGVKETAKGIPEITLKRCAWDRMFFDPYSCEFDFSDANYLGMVRWMDRDEAVATYGIEAAKVFDESFQGHTANETFDDKPKHTHWLQWGKRRRIRVVLCYYKDEAGVWQFAEYTRGGFLRQGVSPWLDDDGQPEHPYVWRSGYIDRDNNRSGMVRDLIDLQDEVNKRRSKALHAANVRQTYGNRKIGDPNEAKKQLNRVDGHVTMEGDAQFGADFGIIPTADITATNLQLLQQAMEAFQLLGPNAAMQGKGSQSASGRSIQANQQGGAIQMGTLSDTLNDMDHEVYRKVWRRIRQFWTAEMWVRVTDDEQKLKWVGINTPQQDEFGQPVVNPMTGEPVFQNVVAEMDVDIIVDSAPHTATLHGEQFAKLVDLAQVVPMPPEIYLAASDLRNKGELIALLKEKSQSQQPDPVQQQLQMAAVEAELGNKQADTANKAAQAQRNQAQAMETAARLQAEQQARDMLAMGLRPL